MEFINRKSTAGLSATIIVLILAIQSLYGHFPYSLRNINKVLDQANKAKLVELYGQLPLSFEANEGQTNGQVKFFSRGKDYELFLTSTEAVIALNKSSSQSKDSTNLMSQSINGETRAIKRSILNIKMVGANPRPLVTGLEELSGKVNYFIGSDRTKWRSNVPTFAKVKYQNVYPGVDLVYYGNKRQLEYDFVAKIKDTFVPQ